VAYLFTASAVHAVNVATGTAIWTMSAPVFYFTGIAISNGKCIGEPLAGLGGQQVRAACVPVLNPGSLARQGERFVAETADPVLHLKRALALDAQAGTNGVVNGVAENVSSVTRSRNDGLVRFPE
jgi:hypothetical protein